MQKTEPTRKLFTFCEFRKMFEVGVFGETDHARVELLDGEVYEMTPMGSRHAACIDRLLGTRSKENALVRVQCPIRLNDDSEPEPAISLLRPRDDFYATSHPKATGRRCASRRGETFTSDVVAGEIPAADVLG